MSSHSGKVSHFHGIPAFIESSGDLEYVAGINVDEVVARPELGAINFAITRHLFEEAKRIALECRDFPLEVGTEDTLNTIVKPLEPLKAAIEDVAAFTLRGTANPEDERDNRSLAMQNALDQFENAVFNVRPRYAVVASDFREPLRQANEIIADARTEAAAELEKVKGFAVEAEEVLRTVREAAKREGVHDRRVIHDRDDHDARKQARQCGPIAGG